MKILLLLLVLLGMAIHLRQVTIPRSNLWSPSSSWRASMRKSLWTSLLIDIAMLNWIILEMNTPQAFLGGILVLMVQAWSHLKEFDRLKNLEEGISEYYFEKNFWTDLGDVYISIYLLYVAQQLGHAYLATIV